MQREARLVPRPRRRLRCEEVGMPFCKATAGIWQDVLQSPSWVLINEKFATLESLGVRILHSVVLLPQRH